MEDFYRQYPKGVPDRGARSWTWAAPRATTWTTSSGEVVEGALENYPGRSFFDYPRFLGNILATPNVLGLKNRLRVLLGDGGYFKHVPHMRYFTPETLGRTLEEAGRR